MRLLERPVEFLFLQSKIPTDHDGTATCEISGKKTTNRFKFPYIKQSHLIALSTKCIFCNAKFVETKKLSG